MNAASIIVLAVVVVLAALALRQVLVGRKQGCDNSCSSCSLYGQCKKRE